VAGAATLTGSVLMTSNATARALPPPSWTTVAALLELLGEIAWQAVHGGVMQRPSDEMTKSSGAYGSETRRHWFLDDLVPTSAKTVLQSEEAPRR
jgi:hypothetical protein